MNKVAAIVVGFRPEMEIIDRLLSSLVDQVDILILVDNGGSETYLNKDFTKREKIKYIDLGSNLGLGRALNVGFEYAVKNGADYVVTFDQDSNAAPNLIESLSQAMKRADETIPNCAAVSPVFFDRRDDVKQYFPFYTSEKGYIEAVFPSEERSEFVKADVLITSGMLVKASVWKESVKYDESFFVDYTDTEWCFRARSLGYQIVGCLSVEMGHAPSDAPPARVFGLSFFRYSPLRRYYFFRNTTRLIKQNYVESYWKRRLIIGLLLRYVVNVFIDNKKLKSLRMMSLGVYHGLANKVGPYVSEVK
ncbi:glycosyltransferase family 2 protein [Pseudomonas sp. URMO17WK12:I12]|jgi:rhamnosyltransferase|uniref:glycosyltransferase family 2 protein n=1 Tax=Pseudomonas sp. URMO17WK12:I12 TaxID=1259797 RepID=UPI000480B083|nr:glycosyltransferase family 2 protein [Pseudomonas sp. URMO17WK12:I12]